MQGLWPSTHRLMKQAGKRLESLDLDPKTCVYLRNRAVSALELHGPNQNWDAFEYPELDAKYSTFIGNDISVDHIGTNSIGSVLDSEFVKVSDFRNELEIPMLPLKDTIAVLGEKCAKESLFKHVLNYADAQKLVRGSDRKMIVEAVGRHLCSGGWVENIWAIKKQAAEQHTPGLVQAILDGEITDSSMGCLVNESICSACSNVATGELPEHEDFCDCILNWKGQNMPLEKVVEDAPTGAIVIPFEINRDISFFEDSLILPFQYGGLAGGEGADIDAKLLEVYANRKKSSVFVPRKIGGRKKAASKAALEETANTEKKSYIGLMPRSPWSGSQNPNVYTMIGDIPEGVEQNRDEFKEQRRQFVMDEKTKDISPDDYPEGTIISITYEGEDMEAIVVEETETGLIVALEGIDEPVEISFEEVNEILETPEDISYEKEMEMVDVATPEIHPEKRSS